MSESTFERGNEAGWDALDVMNDREGDDPVEFAQGVLLAALEFLTDVEAPVTLELGPKLREFVWTHGRVRV